MNDICRMKEHLIMMAQAEIAKGAENICTHDLYECIDMIKDLAECEYYCKVTEAMEKASNDEEPEENYRMGYRAPRYSNGRFAPRMYTPLMQPDIYPIDDLRGYNPIMEQQPYVSSYLSAQKDMKHDQHYTNPQGYSRYGMSYDDYTNAKRNYTTSHDMIEKEKMKQSVNAHVADISMTIKEMYDDADPTLKTQIKAQLQKLITDMK